MPDWDEDSPPLRANLARILERIVEDADRRSTPTIETVRSWPATAMDGLRVRDPRFIGAFRGEKGLEHVQVRVGDRYGVDSRQVDAELERFEATLQRVVAELDARLAAGQQPDADELAAVIDLCAWVHAEWVRIHPFANGNGRTARLWANSIALRYGLPPFVVLRPRPDAGYAEAAAEAMRGDWKPTAALFRRLLADALNAA
jgi:hypothetical protein